MELNAYTRTIRTLFSTNVKYIVPRFQREYSWTKEEVDELWNDIVHNLCVEQGKIVNQEYFIGSLVLIGEDRSPELKIVDGQQRLTTITILLSALVQTFKDHSKDNLASAIYNTYIEGKDDNNEPFFKLINENPKPFLQESIQHITKQDSNPANKEERTLWDAYTFFYDKLKKENLPVKFNNWREISGSEDDKYFDLLKKIRDQIVSFLKVIYITVANEDDAYMIFETLNARGKNLSAVDLVKNELFKKLTGTHPDDRAKRTWKAIQENLSERAQKINIETFFRHYWLSKYNFVRESKIFKSFKQHSSINGFDPEVFLASLKAESETYNVIANPIDSDWIGQENKPVFSALSALSIFQISQIRTFLLALILQRKNGKVAHADFVNFLKQMEHFHFKYTAICSLKMNIFEGKYSKTARDLRQCTNVVQSRQILTDIIEYYKTKEPDLALFTESFNQLKYTRTSSKDKRLIQYIFNKIEVKLRPTAELTPGLITLEHISPQASSTYSNVGKIGNLIPLDKGLNELADSKSFPEKIEIYRRSDLKIVDDFINSNQLKEVWNETEINNRGNTLANFAYDTVWILRE